jgi:hypothetical protein
MMKRQMLKTLPLSVITLTVVFAAAAVSARAQSIPRVKAEIPFEFVVGDRTMAAGEYWVLSSTQDGSAVTIRNAKTADSAIRLSNSMEPRRNDDRARLVFHRYGRTYFLAEIWPGNDATGRQLLKSKSERAVQRELARVGAPSYERVELVAGAR